MENIYYHLAFGIMFYLFQACGSWPEGTYGLPMPKLGCPLGGFTWESGSRTQKTRPGSHAMEGNHLAGMDSEKSEKLTSQFCIKNSYGQDGDHKWHKGKYCIYKKNNCPDGFNRGWIYWDDSVSLVGSDQPMSGVLPDGEYNKNTKIEYCCRTDGYQHIPIQLPRESPFYLLRYGEMCQKVEGMTVTEEWVHWAGVENINWDGQGGTYPFRERANYPEISTKLYYCYYEQEPPNSRYKTLLTVTYVIAAVAALVLIIFILVCITQRCTRCRTSERRHPAETDTMLPPTETTVIYRPKAKQPVQTVVNSSVDNGTPLAPRVTSSVPPTSRTMTTSPAMTNPGGGALVLRDSGEDTPQPGAPPLIADPRPLSLPPSYDEVMTRVQQQNRQPAGGDNVQSRL